MPGTIAVTSSSDDYARVAPCYDLLTRRLLASSRGRVAALCREKGFTRVLDLGCGTGAQCAVLRHKGVHVVGLDASPAMLRVARSSLHRADSVASPALVHSSLPLPFADRSFDAVILSLVLHESASGAVALMQEALRVAPHALVLEWRMPERNLDLPSLAVMHLIERIAGREHYRHFRQFTARGWLRGLLLDAGAETLYEEPCASRFLTLVLAGGIRRLS